MRFNFNLVRSRISLTAAKAFTITSNPTSLLMRPSTMTPLKKNYSTLPSTNFKASELSDEIYSKESEKTMVELLDQLEVLVEAKEDDSYDLEYSSGVLTLTLGNLGTYVINKQPPNKQIWLSSPLSGPKRYDFDSDQGAWFYSRNGERLDFLLSQELSQLLDFKITLKI